MDLSGEAAWGKPNPTQGFLAKSRVQLLSRVPGGQAGPSLLSKGNRRTSNIPKASRDQRWRNLPVTSSDLANQAYPRR